MAYYAAVASLVRLLDDIILHVQYPDLLFDCYQAMTSLHEKFRVLEELLQDYSSKGDGANDHVEGRIREVAYWAQDIIESEISFRIDPKNKNQEAKFVFDLYMVQQQIDSILEEVVMMKERQRNEGLLVVHDSADIGGFEQALSSRNTMVGLDQPLLTIKGQLCGDSPQLQVISVVGTGGIGKTTLVKKTFDDALVMYHFDCRAWVTISQNYDEIRVLQGILKSLGVGVNEIFGEGESELKLRIHKYLSGPRYLVVIDDIWGTKVWDQLKDIFPDVQNGSRIMLTTRLSDIAKYATSSCFLLHEMQFLSEDQSWSLLQKKVFAQEDCPQELEEIGKFISTKCCGLPLALVVIAGLLSNVRAPHDWQKIATNMGTILSKADEHFSNVLSLSYNHLPHHLKACFLYMGGFPEDYEINVSNLIKLWVAEGFLKTPDESKTLENVAEECIEDLVRRNLVIITKKRANGQFKFCVLHDLLRDFCRQRAFHEDFFLIEQEEGHLYPREAENIRCINLYCVSRHQPHLRNPGKLVRSIRAYGLTYCSNFNVFEFDSLTLLRVLDVPERRIRSFEDVILRVFHLRYLSLVVFDLKPISPSISKFQNLQSLILNVVGSIPLELFPQIWNMTQLRHLIIIRLMILPLIPMVGSIPVQKLGYLQTLMTVQGFRFTNYAIETIPNLRKLNLLYFNDENEAHSIWELYCLYNLVHLPHLEELKIRFEVFNEVPSSSFPHGFTFPQNLVKLSLEGCHLPWDVVTVVGSLPNLQVLRLRWNSFVGEEWEPTEGEFGRLKFLLMDNLNLKYWRAEHSHFPRLEHLKVRDCRDLEEIPLEIGDIQTLKFLDVYGSKRVESSVIQIREEQQNLGNEEPLQVRLDYW